MKERPTYIQGLPKLPPEDVQIVNFTNLEKSIESGETSNFEDLQEALLGQKISRDEFDKLIIQLLAKNKSERALIKERLEEAEVALENSGIDGLTGLWRRDRLEPELHAVLMGLKPDNKRFPDLKGVMVVFLDIDDFGKFNKKYGHKAGDRILTLLGFRLMGAEKRNGDKAYRYGGEEFVMVLPLSGNRVSDSTPQILFERLQKEINDNFIFDIGKENNGNMKRMPITLAMGYSFLKKGEPIQTPEDLIHSADMKQKKEKDPVVKKARMKRAREALGLKTKLT